MIRSSVQVRLSASSLKSDLEVLPRGRFLRCVLCYVLCHVLCVVGGVLLMSTSQLWAERPPLLVALDPGHGGLNMGATDPLRPRRAEKYYTLIIAKKIRAHLKRAGVKVWMTRLKDEPLTLQQRMRAASARGVDLYVSVHINDSSVVGPRGHGTFFLAREPFDESRLRLRDFNRQTKGRVIKRNVVAEGVSREELHRLSPVLLDLIHEGAHHEAVHLAHLVNQALEQFSPFGTRGVKQADFGVIKGTAMPAIVCEVGFINHPKEGPFVTSPEGMEQLARGVALGVVRYLSLRHQHPLKVPPALTPPTTEERDRWLNVQLAPSKPSKGTRRGKKIKKSKKSQKIKKSKKSQKSKKSKKSKKSQKSRR